MCSGWRKCGSKFTRSRLLHLLLVILGSGILTSCSQSARTERDPGPQAYYTTAYPARDVSADLDRLLASLVRIQVGASYTNYIFAREEAPTGARLQITGAPLLAQAIDTVRSTPSRAATGSVVSVNSRRVLILTTAHAIHFPDTIIEYFDSQPRDIDTTSTDFRRVESVAIKTRELAAIGTPGIVEPFEIIARNQNDDLALIGVTFQTRPEVEPLRALPLTFGAPARLSWGSLVYVLGYPAGFRMVTQGMVSEPGRVVEGSFLIDGLWNEGMSGAPVIALRGENSEMEWVGIARAASARTDHRLIPEEGSQSEYPTRRPYDGPIYLEEVQDIRYGITFAVPGTVIRRFIDDQRDLLEERGYRVPDL